MKQPAPFSFVRGFSSAVAVATFFLLIAGALVTSTGSGLAVPDWPLSFGRYFPKMEGGIFFEHGHRMIAGCVGIMIFLMSAAAFLAGLPPLIKRLCVIVSCAVLVQALLGGMTVLFHLPAQISVTHAVLAQVVFLLTVGIAVLTWHASAPGHTAKDAAASQISFRAGMLALGLFLGQSFLGAFLRHTGKGLESHMAGAIIASLGTILFIRRVLLVHREKAFLMGGGAAVLILIVQLFLGFSAWRAIFPHVFSRTAHVVTASLLMANVLSLALSFYVRYAPHQVAGKSRAPAALDVSSLSRSAA